MSREDVEARADNPVIRSIYMIYFENEYATEYDVTIDVQARIMEGLAEMLDLSVPEYVGELNYTNGASASWKPLTAKGA